MTDAAALSAAADRTGLSPATAVVVATEPVIFPLLGRDPTAGRYGHLFTDAVGLSLGTSTRFLTTDFRCRAERRATAALLALRLYHLDHGRWPAALAELVPAYLPAVPLDPLVGGNRPIGYLVQPRALPGGRDRVLVDWNGSATGPAGTPPGLPVVVLHRLLPRRRPLARRRRLGRPARHPARHPFQARLRVAVRGSSPLIERQKHPVPFHRSGGRQPGLPGVARRRAEAPRGHVEGLAHLVGRPPAGQPAHRQPPHAFRGSPPFRATSPPVL